VVYVSSLERVLNGEALRWPRRWMERHSGDGLGVSRLLRDIVAALLVALCCVANARADDCVARTEMGLQSLNARDLEVAESALVDVLSSSESSAACSSLAYRLLALTCGSYDESNAFTPCAERLRTLAAARDLVDGHGSTVTARLADEYERDGRFSDAERLWHELLSVEDEETSRASNLVFRANAYQRLASLARKQGRLDVAESYWVASLSLADEQDPTDTLAAYGALIALGRAYNEDGRSHAAVVLLERAVTLVEVLWGNRSPAVAETLEEYSRALIGIGRVEEAKEARSRALEIRKLVEQQQDASSP